MPVVTEREWDEYIQGYPGAHILQTSSWGKLKGQFGWEAFHLVVGPIGAQILFRRFLGGLCFAYIAKGPLGMKCNQNDLENNPESHFLLRTFFNELDSLCRRKRAVFLKIEPDCWEPEILPDVFKHNFSPGLQSIQPRRTIMVSLVGDGESILARMKQKTRYNIRLAMKKGVSVQAGSDFEQFYLLMKITGRRDNFEVHDINYYRKVYKLFYPRGECELLFARYEGKLLGVLMVFSHGKCAWYFYGGSSDEKREYMASYLLQWEAMRWAHSKGCLEYDLWGVPDVSSEILEQDFTSRSDGLWGVYRFKRGFGGELRRSAGSFDRVYNPGLYFFYQWWLKFRGV